MNDSFEESVNRVRLAFSELLKEVSKVQWLMKSLNWVAAKIHRG